MMVHKKFRERPGENSFKTGKFSGKKNQSRKFPDVKKSNAGRNLLSMSAQIIPYDTPP
jgi:hypothetical protein